MMRRVTILFLAVVATLSMSCQQQPRVKKTAEPSPQATIVKSPYDMPTPVVGKPYFGRGVVKFINVKEGWIEINHEAIEGLMPAMQMEWWVKDRALLKTFKLATRLISQLSRPARENSLRS